jgi:phospholipase/carboxylesterase
MILAQTRYGFLLWLALAAGATFAAAAEPDRLELPASPPTAIPAFGVHRLESGPRGGLLYVPKSYRPGEPLPLVVLLHASGGDAWDWFGSYGRRAEAGRFIVVAPDCLHKTWGAGPKDFGRDAAVINRALGVAASQCAIDRKRLAIGGFSDGASYALSLGIANGDLFQNVIAFSPGYFIGKPRRGHPALFIAHGVSDEILPLDVCSRRFVPSLRQAGYTVEYREFFGGHEVPDAVSDRAMDWLTARFRNPP